MPGHKKTGPKTCFIWTETIRSMPGEEQKSHNARLFDGVRSLPLLTRGKASVSARLDLSVVAGDVAQQGKIFVINVVQSVESFSGRFCSHKRG